MPKILEENNRTQTLKEIKLEVSKEEIDQTYSKVMREIQKDFVAPGFRKGKVPFNIIENKVGQGYIFQKVVESSVDESLRNYLSSINQSVVSINNIKLEVANYERIVYSVLIEVEPVFDVPDDVEVEVNKLEINIEQEIEKRFIQIRDQFSSFQETNREIKEGDRVDIYFEIKDSKSGVTLAGGDNNVYQVLAVKEMLLPGVYEHLIGMKKEEEKEFEIDGPANIEQFKDKKLRIKIKVSNVLEKQIPPDEELLKLVNYKSLDDLKRDIKNVIEQEKENIQKDLVFSRYLSFLRDKIDFEIPETWFKKEKEFQKNNFLQLLSRQNRTLDDYLKSSNLSQEDFEKNIENIAKENIKRAIIINNLLRKYNITFDNLEVEYYLKNDVETQRYVFDLSQLKLSQEEINYRLSQFIMMKKLKEEVFKRVKIKYVEQISPSK
ncbi:MAG: trigger factor [Candidatus Calescibacterium sp.]|nr:trigger factor [Candidatus Calescibacterium sp.]MDW8132491.1 trigger factor [Candidatus Calescibacterium sp.]